MTRLPELDSSRDLQGYARRGQHSPGSLVEHMNGLVHPHSQSHISRDRTPSLHDLGRVISTERNALPPLYMTTASISPTESNFSPSPSFPLRQGCSNPTTGMTTPTSSMPPMAATVVPLRLDELSTRRLADSNRRASPAFPNELPQMRVASGRIEKPSPRRRPAMTSRRSSTVPTATFGLHDSGLRRTSILSQPSSFTSDLSSSQEQQLEAMASNKKAGKERHARENLQTVIKSHYDIVSAAGIQFKTRLNSHNSSVSGIPCKKEEVLDLSYNLHCQKDQDITALQNLTKDHANLMHKIQQRAHEMRDLIPATTGNGRQADGTSSPDPISSCFLRIVDDLLSLSTTGTQQPKSLTEYYTPEPTPSPEPMASMPTHQ